MSKGCHSCENAKLIKSGIAYENTPCAKCSLSLENYKTGGRKTEFYEGKLYELEEIYDNSMKTFLSEFALAIERIMENKTRRKIFKLWLKDNTITGTDLAQITRVSRQTACYHLHTIKQSLPPVVKKHLR